MKILLSNDDGYLAPGLAALRRALDPIADIIVVAPERNHSGSSNSLTLDRPLRVQHLESNFYAINGVIRKLADVEQRIDYEKFMDGYDREVMSFTLTGNYYPTKILSFGGSFLYRYHDYGSDNMILRLNSGLYFPKFQVDFSYDYGTDDDRETVVQRYEVNVRKVF